MLFGYLVETKFYLGSKRVYVDKISDKYKHHIDSSKALELLK